MNSESGERPASQVKTTDREARRRPLIAGLLSFLIPGLGQLYNGEMRKAGILYLCDWVLNVAFIVGLAYRTFYGLVANVAVPVVFHFVVIVEAAVRARRLGSIRLRRFNRWYVYVLVIAFWASSLGISLDPASKLRTWDSKDSEWLQAR